VHDEASPSNVDEAEVRLVADDDKKSVPIAHFANPNTWANARQYIARRSGWFQSKSLAA
jgi:hypothetical protein